MRRLCAVLGGDGIGPEVTAAAVAVCRAAIAGCGVELAFVDGVIGGGAIDLTGSPLPAETLDLCRRADAVLLGAVGGPQWDGAGVRPEQGLLALREGLGAFANLRPVRPHPLLAGVSPLRPELLRGVDVLFVRELTGGIYFGAKERDGDRAVDTCVYTVAEVERVVRVACRCAADRRGLLTSVDKANVLETSRLWREVTTRVVRTEFKDLRLEHLLVDAMAMHLLRRPGDFDVVVTENMFGDILTDEASMLCGSLGMLPSASLGAGTAGIYEPVHGSAPDIAGADVANPYGATLSVAMALRHSLDLAAAADRIEAAVSAAIADGFVTADVAAEGQRPAGTAAVTEAVIARL